jgi:N-acetylneuraminic acid mutarotase
VVLNGYIYVLGGKTTNGTVLNTVERFDPSSNTWDNSIVAPFDKSRYNAAAVVMNNSIYLVGGRENDNELLKKVEVYHVPSNSWDEIQQMDNRREGHVAVILRGGICVIGGKDENGAFLQEIEWYNESEDKWYAAPSNLSSPKTSAFAAAIDDTVYLFGGFNPLPSLYNFKGATDPGWYFTWTVLPPLQIGRGFGATAQLGDSIFIMGGRTLNDTTAAVEILNLQTQQIEAGPSLPIPRAGMAGVTLNNEIYVIGGVSEQNQPLSLVEIYGPLVSNIIPPTTNIPNNFAQINGYPNPFNGIIQLRVNVPQRGSNEIDIYDVQGRRVKSIHRGSLTAGEHTFRWEGNDELNLPVTSGIYFAVLKGSNYLKTFKIVYIR